MGRAIAHGATTAARFEDPTAIALLGDEARARVERVRSGSPPRGLRARAYRAYLRRQSKMMVARTVAIDDAIRALGAPQLVILGAGLDGRAWRMPELRDAIVFEVDHPDSQREKRSRASSLTRAAREVRFVPVDFERDSLDEALAAAGHDPLRPTTWVWEGVVMYLTPADVERTLGLIARRSAAGSRLVVAYHAPALLLRFLGVFTRRLGEPLRSTFTADAMRALLARHRFEVVRDDAISTLGAALSADIGAATKVVKHLRIVTADRPAR
jgi:methyltransferase (TIGR00027 family)